MIDDDLNSEENELTPQDSDQEVLSQDDSQKQAEAEAKEKAAVRDWRAMRQRQKEMEIEIKQKNELLDRFLKSQEKSNVQEVVEEDDADDDYVPAGRVKGIARKTVQPLEKKIQELENKIAQQEQNKLIQSLKTQFSDFDDVVNIETLELFEKNEPELAATIGQMTDQYKMGLHAYKYIKALGLVDKVPDSRRSKEISKKIDQSNKTVQSPSAYNKRPMAQAFKSTQAEKTALYEEMMFFAGKASSL